MKPNELAKQELAVAQSRINSKQACIMCLRSHLTRSVLLLALLVVGFVSSEAQTWRSLGGANPYVHRIKVWQNPTMLVACADSAQPYKEDANAALEFYSGEGYRVSTDDGATWSASKLDGFSVRDIIRIPGDNQTWIAAVVKPFAFTGGTMRSTNAGTDWPPFAENDLVTIEQMIVRGTGPVEVYAGLFGTSQGFQVSHDSCRTWLDRTGSPVSFPISTRAIAVSPLNDSIMFVGGDARALPGILHTTDLGLTWQKDTVGIGGKRILCITPSKYFPNVVYCGTDSISDDGVMGTGMYKSNDTGSTWRLLEGSEGTRVWSILEHPTNAAVLLAAADSIGVITSGNYGHGWEAANDGLPSGVVARTLAFVEGGATGDGIAAYLGTYGQGVFKSIPIIADVAEERAIAGEGIRIAPTPTSDHATITVPFATSDLTVLDVTGRTVMIIQAQAETANQSIFRLNTSGVPSGSYRVVATNGLQRSVGILSVVR